MATEGEIRGTGGGDATVPLQYQCGTDSRNRKGEGVCLLKTSFFHHFRKGGNLYVRWRCMYFEDGPNRVEEADSLFFSPNYNTVIHDNIGQKELDCNNLGFYRISGPNWQ